MLKFKQTISFCIICSLIISFTNTSSESASPIVQPKINADAIIADHTIMNLVRLNQIPDSAIIEAKNTLHIAYEHTSHGSQIITGMNDLSYFKENYVGTQAGSSNFTDGLYDWNEGGTEGALDIDDNFASGDLGNPDYITWENLTRIYLETEGNEDVNVVMWSWCGQVSPATEENIDTYLGLMVGLEADYPDIDFVYMTGHTDGSGLEGNLHIRNEQIRTHCTTHGKILFDFADIESYDPDGNYYGDKLVMDTCAYDSNNDSTRDGNWAIEWQTANPNEWYDCVSAHSEPLNANQKAYAIWWLWATLAGWNQTTVTPTPTPTPTPSSSEPPTSKLPIAASIFGLSTILSAVFISIIFVEKRRK